MKKSIIISVILIIAAFLIGYGWGAQKGEVEEGAGEIEEEQAEKKEAIKIAFVAPLSGDAASWGLPIQKGAQIALDKINNEGGIDGRQLELIFEDTKCDGKEAVTIANKLVNINKMQIIIGDVCSSATLAMAPITEQNKVLLFSQGSSSPDIRTAGEYVFSIYPLDDHEAGLAVDFAYEKLGKRTAAILYSNNDYGQGGKNVIERDFTEKGGHIALAESYLIGASDFRTQLTKIKDSTVDVLFIWGQPNEMVPILMQTKELDLQTQILTSGVIIETDSLKEAGVELANGIIYTYLQAGSNINSQYLNEEYNKRHQEDPGLLSPFGYDPVILIGEAIRKVGLDATAVKDYLLSLNNFPGASGEMSFDKDGTVIKDFIFKTVKDGQFVEYAE